MELKENEMLLYLKKTGIPVVVELGEVADNGQMEIAVRLEEQHQHLLEAAMQETEEIIQVMLAEMAEDLKKC